jgi:hypothetical protein
MAYSWPSSLFLTLNTSPKPPLLMKPTVSNSEEYLDLGKDGNPKSMTSSSTVDLENIFKCHFGYDMIFAECLTSAQGLLCLVLEQQLSEHW